MSRLAAACLLFSALVTAPRSAHACECTAVETWEQVSERAPYVVEARVVAFETRRFRHRDGLSVRRYARLAVVNVRKGTLTRDAFLIKAGQGKSCERPLDALGGVGDTVVLALPKNPDDGPQTLTTCSNSLQREPAPSAVGGQPTPG